MKAYAFLALAAAMAAAACGNGGEGHDASGVFETTEVTVAARGAGEITRLDAEEGQALKAGQAVGQIDTVQLSLRRDELKASLRAAGSHQYDVARQVASLRSEIATAERERRRYEALVADKAANAKQLDDINARIDALEAELQARRETRHRPKP